MPEIALSVGILAVPERRHYVQGLLAMMGHDADDYHVDVYWDDDHRGLWWNARRLWADTPSDCTHRLLLQDDIEVGPAFLPAVEKVAAARPDAFVSLFCYAPEQDAYAAAGVHWMPYTRPAGCAQLLPAAWAHEFVAWADSLDGVYPVEALAKRGPKAYALADDTMLLTWLRLTQRPAWVTVPGLVKHLAWHDSVFLLEQRKGVTQAELYLGSDRSGLEIDWAEGV